MNVLEIVRRCLEIGQSVEIDGLGTFRARAQGGFEFTAESRPQVFIAYVQEDLHLARRLCERGDPGTERIRVACGEPQEGEQQRDERRERVPGQLGHDWETLDTKTRAAPAGTPSASGDLSPAREAKGPLRSSE